MIISLTLWIGMNMRKTKLDILSILIGVLMPLIAALVPSALKIMVPDHKFEYTMSEPIIADGATAVKFVIRNTGTVVEKNVNVIIKRVFINQPESYFSKKSNAEPMHVSSETKCSVDVEDGYNTIRFGDLRPADTIEASVLLNGEYRMLSIGKKPYGVSVKSDDRVAEFGNIADVNVVELINRFGFSLFIVVFCLITFLELFRRIRRQQ